MILLNSPITGILGQTDYSWWNEKHNWDGVSDWTDYLIITPAFLGPNALPVPELKNGCLSSDTQFELGTEGHYSVGDQTINLHTDLYLPLFTDRAALQITYRPVEWYQTDTITRDLRRSREYDPSGLSFGDFYVGTYIQLIKGHPSLPDLLLSANIKTASGTNLAGARHTDSPGYWFDATFSKHFAPANPSLKSIRLYAKGGFYCYQNYGNSHFQNDAFLYGAGISFNLKKLSIQNQVTGFIGYFNRGDKPMVYRLIIEGTGNTTVSFRAVFQQGLNDFDFTSLRLSALVRLNRIFSKLSVTH